MFDFDAFVPPVSETPSSFDGLKGSRLVVLGAGSITREIVKAFLQLENTQVVIGRRSEEAVQKNVAEFEAEFPGNSSVFGTSVDASNEGSVRDFVQFSRESMGGIDTALFGVGGFPPGANLDQNQDISGLDSDAVLGQLNSDLVGGLRFAQALEPFLKETVQQTKKQARLGFIGSIGPDCSDSSYGYNIAKRGTLQLMEMLADHWAPWCGVNAVSPGVIPSALNAERMAETSARGRGAVRFTVAGRYGKTIDVAQAFLFILNPDNAWMTGANIIVDGGITVARKYGGPDADDMLKGPVAKH